jgi:crossover junction endodeoxyribonuclease RuvC
MGRVIGLDLSLTGTGVASSLGHVDTITSKAQAAATLAARRARLRQLASEIVSRCKSPLDLVVIEAPAFSRTTGHMHDRSGLWWLVVDALHGNDFPVVEVTATQRAKYATGKGNAAKDAVLAAVVRRYPDVEVSNNNEADALVLAAMGTRALGHPIETSLPVVNLAAMDAVRWPFTLPDEAAHEQGDIPDDMGDDPVWPEGAA